MNIPVKILTAVALYAVTALFLMSGGQPALSAADDESPESVHEKAVDLDIRGPFHQQGNFEIGGYGGMPSGLNMRYWFVDVFGMDITLGSTLQRDFSATVDLLVEFIELYRSSTLGLRFFFGAGALVGYQDDDFYSNVRFPIGLSMPFESIPLTLSLYAAPACIVKPDTEFDVNWGIAARFNLGLAQKMKRKETLLNYRLASLQQGYGRVKDKLDTTQKELDQAIGELNRTGGELHMTRGQLDKTMHRLMNTKKELEGTKTELSDTRQKLDSTITDLSAAKGKLVQANSKIADMKRELDGTKTRLDKTRQELSISKKRLDDRERELSTKQSELDNARNMLNTALSDAISGKERKEEEKKLAAMQEELNREKEKFNKEKEQWARLHEKQKKRREKLRKDCEARRGIINEDGYCDCREHEQWNSDRSACVCVKGYRLNPATDRCEPCEIVTYDGSCTESCGSDEKKVPLTRGPHKYVCIKKCRKQNEMWSERKQRCVCKDGYYRDEKGNCVPRR